MPYGARPGSSIRGGGMGAPPGTGVRLTTGMRLGTGAAGGAYGVSLGSEVSISDRPVTQQGVMGIRMKTAGPGRQVMDATYFSSILRSKVSEITTEIDNLQGQIEKHHRDTLKKSTLERQYDDLFKEVRELEGQLADYNLAMDKSRSGTDSSELDRYRQQVKEKNTHEAKEADKIFLARAEREREVQDIEDKINQIHRENEDRINNLDPAARDQYHNMMKTNDAFRQDLNSVMGKLDQINEKIRAYEDELSRDVIRDEYSNLEKQLLRLRKDKLNLEDEVAATKLDPKAAREQLLNKVKSDHNKLKELDSKVADMREEHIKLKKHISDLSASMAAKGGENAEAKKYEMLHKRDMEMSDFISKFDDIYTNEMNEQVNIEETVVALLEHISTQINKEAVLPTKDEYNEMKDDLTFKEQQMKTSASTQAKLVQELKKRNTELEKINLLDDKITKELATLEQKSNLMKSEMVEFSMVDKLRDDAEKTKQKLSELKRSYQKRRDSVKQQVSGTASRYEKIKTELLQNDTAKGLDALEQKLRNYEQNIFSLNEYVETKGRETDYEGLKDKCFDTIDTLNSFIIKNQIV